MKRSITLFFIIISSTLYIPLLGYSMLKTPLILHNESRYVAGLGKDEIKIYNWIKENTEETDVILFAPETDELENIRETTLFWSGIEVFLNRPTYVNYKFVPTKSVDIAEWFKRLNLRRDAFRFGCNELKVISPEYVLATNIDKNLKNCLKTTFQTDSLMIAKFLR